jgi:hypothetical protein
MVTDSIKTANKTGFFRQHRTVIRRVVFRYMRHMFQGLQFLTQPYSVTTSTDGKMVVPHVSPHENFSKPLKLWPTATVHCEAMRNHRVCWSARHWQFPHFTFPSRRVGVTPVMEGRVGESKGALFSSKCGSTDSFIGVVIGRAPASSEVDITERITLLSP